MTQKRIACPSCRSVGADSSGNHLKLYDSGTAGYCRKEAKTIFLKDWAEGVQESKPRMRNSYDTLDLARVSQLPIKAYPERKISLEAMEHFGVRTGVSQNDGNTPAEHYYPYFDEYGKISGYKRRVLPKQRFDSVEGSKIKGFFGQNKAVGDNFIILVEGEGETLAAYDMMKFLRPDRAPYNVVSLPHGADENGILDQTTKKGLEWLGKFKKVILMLDMDAPGRATALAIADYLVSHTEVLIAELPLKDTADMWEAGRSKEWGEAINKAKKYVSDQIVLGTDTPLKELLQPIPAGLMFPFLPRTCEKLDGFRPKEMTTLISPPNTGKSSLFRQMMHHTLSVTPDPVGCFFLEEGTSKTKQSILAYNAGIPLNKFRKMSEQAKESNHKVIEAYETLLPRLHLFEHKRKVLTDDFIERKIEYMVKALGCKLIMFDHLSYVIGGRTSTNERKDIDMLMTRLSQSVELWDYHLLLVSHIKRGEKEKSKNKKEYPYWEYLDMADGRGSGAIEQLSHNMIALEKEVLDPAEDSTRGMVRTRILRAREWGATGMGDTLTWNEHGQFAPVTL